jgi:hypothetical protein
MDLKEEGIADGREKHVQFSWGQNALRERMYSGLYTWDS